MSLNPKSVPDFPASVSDFDYPSFFDTSTIDFVISFRNNVDRDSTTKSELRTQLELNANTPTSPLSTPHVRDDIDQDAA